MAWGGLTINTVTGGLTFNTEHADYVAARTSLHAGETEILALRAQVTDAEGATDTQAFTVTVTGANDAPVLDTGVIEAEQASVIYHGVKFEVVAPGAAGNNWQVDILETNGASRLQQATAHSSSSTSMCVINALSPRLRS